MDFRVGSWQVRPDMDTLVGKGEPCHLSPKAMDVLVCLATKRGQVVGKEDLIETVWKGTFVSDDALTRCIAELRRAFEDNAREPAIIQTIPKRGFALLPEVTWEQEVVEPSASESRETPLKNDAVVPTSKATTTILVSAKWKGFGLAIALLTVIAIAVVFPYLQLHRGPQEIHRIAVLPFTNTSGDPQQDYLADGMTEQLITEMAHISAWQVISRTSVMRYKGTTLALPQVASNLGADRIMEGTVQRSSGRVRITAQLIDARTDVHLWSGSFEKDMSDVLALQSEIARTIARELDVKLSEKERARLNSPSVVVPEAYDSYLIGRHFHDRGQYAKAASYFEQATRADPNFALAYAYVYESLSMLYYSQDLPKGQQDALVTAAGNKALELDPNLAEAHLASGDIAFFENWNWAAGEAEFRRAVELDQASTGAALHYAYCLHVQGRWDEAIVELQRALRLDPVAPVPNAQLIVLFINAHRYDDALAQFQKATELNPDSYAAYFFAGQLFEQMGRNPEAIAAYMKSFKLSGATDEELRASERATAIEGIRGYWQVQLRKYQQKQGRERVSPFSLARLYIRLGNKDMAMRMLEASYREHSPHLAWIHANSWWDPLRSDPRFQSLLQRMNFPK